MEKILMAIYKCVITVAILLTPSLSEAQHHGGAHMGGHVGGFHAGMGYHHYSAPVYHGPYYHNHYYVRPYIGFGFGYPYYQPYYRPYYVPVYTPVYVPAPAPRVPRTHIQMRLNGMREQTREYVDVTYSFGNRRVPVINGYVPNVIERTTSIGDKVIIYDYQARVSLADVQARGSF